MAPPNSYSSPPDSGRIRCICDVDEDDGFTIQCEQCLVWQHAKCVGIGKTSVPEQYFCEECNPGGHEDLHFMALKVLGLDQITTNPAVVAPNASVPGHNSPHSNAPSNLNPPRLPSNSNVSLPSHPYPSPASPLTASFISCPPGAPALNEISENIISTEARSITDSFMSSLNLNRLLRQQVLSTRLQQSLRDPSQLNYEFQSMVLVTTPTSNNDVSASNSLAGMSTLHSWQKALEVREIRARGYQKKGISTRYGLFTSQPLDPGQYVAPFLGQLLPKASIAIKGHSSKDLPLAVTQSFVLFPMASVDLAVDARKFGNPVRYCRRSCRPNVQIKPIIVATEEEKCKGLENDRDREVDVLEESPLQSEAGQVAQTVPRRSASASLVWGLFTKNVIRAGSELLLPLDYACGNGVFRYECACNAPDFCLGLLENFTANATGSSIGAGLAITASPSAELEALGIRRSSSAAPLTGGGGGVSAAGEASEHSVPSIRPVLDARKLSREERKLQQYIEYFEKLDSAEAAKKSQGHAQHSASSLSISSTASASRRSSSQPSSPKQSQEKLTRPSSPKAVAGLKKSWKSLFSESGGDEGEGMEESAAAILEAESVTSVPVPPVKGKRGRKPGKSATKTSHMATGSSNEPSAAKATAAKKRAGDNEAIDVDGGVTGVGSSQPSTAGKKTKNKDLETSNKRPKTTTSLAHPEPKKPLRSKEAAEDRATSSSPIIDIERTSSSFEPMNNANTLPLSGSSASINASPTKAHPSTSASASVSPSPVVPDTPSKKKVSLSDYLKKKKASPSGPMNLSFDDVGQGKLDEAGVNTGVADGGIGIKVEVGEMERAYSSYSTATAVVEPASSATAAVSESAYSFLASAVLSTSMESLHAPSAKSALPYDDTLQQDIHNPSLDTDGSWQHRSRSFERFDDNARIISSGSSGSGGDYRPERSDRFERRDYRERDRDRGRDREWERDRSNYEQRSWNREREVDQRSWERDGDQRNEQRSDQRGWDQDNARHYQQPHPHPVDLDRNRHWDRDRFPRDRQPPSSVHRDWDFERRDYQGPHHNSYGQEQYPHQSHPSQPPGFRPPYRPSGGPRPNHHHNPPGNPHHPRSRPFRPNHRSRPPSDNSNRSNYRSP